MAKTMIASVVTDGQIENLVAKYRDALRKHRDELSPSAVQQVIGMENVGMSLYDVTRKQAEATMLLAPRGTMRVVLKEPHNPYVYYYSSPSANLSVWTDFSHDVARVAKRSDAGETFEIGWAKLMHPATMEEIADAARKFASPASFNPEQMCALIACLIANQDRGKRGPLLTNCGLNLFHLLYTHSMVGVQWDGVQNWQVSMQRGKELAWNPGQHVFFLYQ